MKEITLLRITTNGAVAIKTYIETPEVLEPNIPIKLHKYNICMTQKSGCRLFIRARVAPLLLPTE